MLEQGLEQEIRDLLAEGISPEATAMQAIGYKEFVSALQGNGTMEEAADRVRQSSRRYAKRQLTWFRRHDEAFWLPADRLATEEQADRIEKAFTEERDAHDDG
jgi:tRNA dimethylallyltransferase